MSGLPAIDVLFIWAALSAPRFRATFLLQQSTSLKEHIMSKTRSRLILTILILFTGLALSAQTVAQSGTSTGASHDQALAPFAQAAMVSVVVRDNSSELKPVATGFLVQSGQEVVVVAPHHNLQPGQSLFVQGRADGLSSPAEVIAFDAQLDLAVLRLSSESKGAHGITAGAPPTIGSDLTLMGLASAATPFSAPVTVSALPGPDAQGVMRQIRFRSALAVDSRGEILVDASGRAIAIFTGQRLSTIADEHDGFLAVPISTVNDLLQLAIGAQASSKAPEYASQREASTNTHTVNTSQLSKAVRTFYVVSKTTLIPRDHMVQALRNTKDFEKSDLVLVENPQDAEVMVTVDFIPFTFDYTFKAVDRLTDVVLVAGRVTAFNGYIAAPELAGKIVRNLERTRSTVSTATK
jgi:hypothetical protein